ncbi:MAG: Holliday junction branch migration protein RuvA [Nitrospinae bacterium]|nr:Holliday junction branch migration protein RuvA [Nitrospinota bacterium]
MIAFLRGTLLEKSPQTAVMDVNGVGYRLFITLSGYESLPQAGQPAQMHTVTIAREDALHLYGFADKAEKEMFLKLNSVTRIGPKLACAILSGIRPDALANAVAAGDKTRLSKVPGVGGKTAERIIMELKDKLGPAVVTAEGAATPDRDVSDAVAALVNLGYQKAHAEKAALKAAEDSTTLAELIRKSLKLLSL